MSQQINLYNPLLLRQQKIFSARTMLQALAVLVLGMVVFGGYAKYQVAQLANSTAAAEKRLKAEQERTLRLTQQFAPRKKSGELEVEIQRAEQQLQSLKQVLSLVQQGSIGSQRGFSGYFQALARQSMEGLWLTGFAVAGTQMEIAGRTLKPELLPDYLRRLGEEKTMQGQTFAALEMRRPTAAVGKDGKPGPAAPYIEFTLQSQPKDAAK